MASLSVCVFCGSRPGARPTYEIAATQVGKEIAERRWRLVYGAGDIGLMGAVARSAQEAGADTFGVIPIHLLEREVGKTDLKRFIVTETMHERKKVMFMNCDAIVVLPGGAGSLDEFFEVLTWAQLGLHQKPILLLDTEGYWQPLVSLVNHVVDEGFADSSLLNLFSVVSTVDALFEVLDTAAER
ncbi:hypothetical protein SAMN05421688_0189 [Poseidonocella pacifica]|uniref:Cytokinin riboside 5'-monophosphate phosphoribohydrolase n=1 Tax=Poseidonocella pacifica TaxID=871651 RepID=A0A1I0V3I7_9RHOB|nr:TIGR00730 family Rossman fold protein [Poseidonocella pacifica]SFA70106.1 hypothetical protein SAMN05421688_0189 [Poseidonocella pacifica]